MIFPWQTEQWQQLMRAKQQHRLPHALLFTGLAGTGKFSFADSFSRSLLCQDPAATGEPCYHCHSCRLIEGRAHQNMMWIEPEKEGQAIKIDQVRDVSEFISQSSLQGNHRIVIINPADAMNKNAANALLKTLEEPSAGALLILISNQSERLPATILSRCQCVTFQRPTRELALTWLKSQIVKNDVNHELLLNLANGAPLAAAKLVDDAIFSVRDELFNTLYSLSKKQGDPIKSAAKLYNNDPIRIVDFTLSWMLDLLRLQLDGDMGRIINTDFEKQLAELSLSTQIIKNTNLMDYLQQLRSQICIGINFNKQLMLEGVLIRWLECA